MLREYLQRASQAVGRKDGKEVARLLRTDDAQALAIAQKAQSTKHWRNDASSYAWTQEWADIFTSHLLATTHVWQGDMVAAYEQLAVYEPDSIDKLGGAKRIEHVVREAQESWIIEPCIRMAANLRYIAEKADSELKRKNTKPDKLEDCGRILTTYLNALFSAKGKHVKKMALLGVMNQLFTVYTRLNNLNQIKQTLKNFNNQIANMSVPAIESFPLQYQVPFRYRWGQLQLYEEDYAEAEQHLMAAFTNCPATSGKNLKRILRLLIPVRMLRGVLPSDALLQQHGFHELKPVAQAVRLGDVGMLSRTLDTHYMRFISAGTYLILEKLKLVVYRQLLRNVTLVHQEQFAGQDPLPSKAQQVPMAVFEAMLREQGEDIDAAGAECILANLIFRGFIKGYISHAARVVVIAKGALASAFPSLSTVELKDPSNLLL